MVLEWVKEFPMTLRNYAACVEGSCAHSKVMCAWPCCDSFAVGYRLQQAMCPTHIHRI